MTESIDARPSTVSLIGDAIGQATALVSAELRLVRLEATEKLLGAVMALVAIAAAAVFMIVALIFLLQGVVELLASLLHWPLFAASFAVGGGLLLVAIVAIAIAGRRLSAAHLVPARTLRQVAKTAESAKEIVS